MLVRNAEAVVIRRVRVAGCLHGIRLANVTRGRVEGSVVTGNRYGVIIAGGAGNVVVNCTLAGNASLGLSLPSGRGIVAFNNVIVGSATGVFVGAAVEGLTGVGASEDQCGIDGCSIPTWATPLSSLAHAFARFGTGRGLGVERQRAAARIRAAIAAQPYFIAGTGRFCTDVMTLFGARVLVKTGAEGVFCGALPEQGLGIALKCEDGAGRAAEVAMAATIERFLPLSDDERQKLARFVRKELRNWNGIAVGGLRPAASLAVVPGERSETRDP